MGLSQNVSTKARGYFSDVYVVLLSAHRKVHWMAIIPCGSTSVAQWGIRPQPMLRSYAMNKIRTSQCW